MFSLFEHILCLSFLLLLSVWCLLSPLTPNLSYFLVWAFSARNFPLILQICWHLLEIFLVVCFYKFNFAWIEHQFFQLDAVFSILWIRSSLLLILYWLLCVLDLSVTDRYFRILTSVIHLSVSYWVFSILVSCILRPCYYMHINLELWLDNETSFYYYVVILFGDAFHS